MHLFDSRTRALRAFSPIDPARVRVYVCGPTVYDRAHLGNARSAVVFDVLHRLLRHTFDLVVFVRNLTDIDDKIIARARDNHESIGALTERTAQYYADDMAALGVLDPTHAPRATDYIAPMQAMIAHLIAKGHAYLAHGHVFFSVRSNPRMGMLAQRPIDDMVASHRAETGEGKQDPADFVLWKPSPEAMPGWDSPWGRGRPGWHIECSAMIHALLGVEIDIHGGGEDLLFPHHENEEAQSCCAHGSDRLARFWMHNGMLTVRGTKMSKSAGNFTTVADALQHFPARAEAVRMLLLSGHYRQTLDFSYEAVGHMVRRLDGLYNALRGFAPPSTPYDLTHSGVLAALNNDLNTPLALARLHETARALTLADGRAAQDLAARLRAEGALLGLLNQDLEAWFQGEPTAEIEALVAKRQAARALRHWAEADEARAQLSALNVVVEDTPQGPRWKRVIPS